MESSEQEAGVVKTDINADVKDSTVESTSDEAPLTGGVLTKKMEARLEHTPDIDSDMEEEGGVAEKDRIEASDSGQDAPRWTSSGVETYAVQCNSCFKWRIIPSKEKYEAIGEHILEQPFVCEGAQDWKKDITCDSPADLEENEPSVLWAIDKHNIPCPPKGFYRKVVLRAENAKKFADIYYKTPCGKTLRSMIQVQKYLDEHPDVDAKICQFSFTCPKGRAEPTGTGVSSKRAMKDGTQSGPEPRKRMKAIGYGSSALDRVSFFAHDNKPFARRFLPPVVSGLSRFQPFQLSACLSLPAHAWVAEDMDALVVGVSHGTIFLACVTSASVTNWRSAAHPLKLRRQLNPLVWHSDRSRVEPYICWSIQNDRPSVYFEVAGVVAA